jgi:hypothetical protein
MSLHYDEMDNVDTTGMMMPQPDVRVQNEGSIFLLHPITPRAQAWMDDNLPEPADWQQFSTGYVVEHRYVGEILRGMVRSNLVVS